MMRRLSNILFSIMLSLPALAWALASDRQQPIHIEADSVEMDETKGISIYQGDVRFVQGSIVLTADRVTIYSEQQQVVKVVAVGFPVHYEQKLDNDKGDMRARAEKIEYYPVREEVLLYGDAFLWQRDNQFTGDYIKYSVKDEVIVAHKDEGSDKRIRIIIQPQDKTPQSTSSRQAQPR